MTSNGAEPAAAGCWPRRKIEYDPRPPFESGHPRNGDPKLVEAVTARAAPRQDERRAQVEKAAKAGKVIPSP